VLRMMTSMASIDDTLAERNCNRFAAFEHGRTRFALFSVHDRQRRAQLPHSDGERFTLCGNIPNRHVERGDRYIELEA
jgi:hypothetical protein